MLGNIRLQSIQELVGILLGNCLYNSIKHQLIFRRKYSDKSFVIFSFLINSNGDNTFVHDDIQRAKLFHNVQS